MDIQPEPDCVITQFLTQQHNSKLKIMQCPGRQYLNNIKKVLDSPQSARALLLNYEQRSRLAKVKWGFFNSIPRLSIVSILRRFVLDIDERPPRRAIVKRGI